MNAPVFILGLQRSGTTLLYQMLAASGEFSISTAWHVICFDQLRMGIVDVNGSRRHLQQQFDAAGLKNRGMDTVACNPDMPEEYGFVLDNRGYGMMLTQCNGPVFKEFCSILYRYPYNPAGSKPSDTLLLKNTWDFTNVGQLVRMFPEARFVFIHRNPVQIVSSLFRVVSHMVFKGYPYLEMISERYRAFAQSTLQLLLARAFCRYLPNLLAKGIIHFTARQARTFVQSLPTLPLGQIISIQYETLCAQPDETMSRLLAFVRGDRKAANLTRSYAHMIGPHAVYIEPQITSHLSLIARCFSDYAQIAGYNLSGSKW